jgi:hypothetical protein
MRFTPPELCGSTNHATAYSYVDILLLNDYGEQYIPHRHGYEQRNAARKTCAQWLPTVLGNKRLPRR